MVEPFAKQRKLDAHLGRKQQAQHDHHPEGDARMHGLHRYENGKRHRQVPEIEELAEQAEDVGQRAEHPGYRCEKQRPENAPRVS